MVDAERVLVLGHRSRLARALVWAGRDRVRLAERSDLWSAEPEAAPQPAGTAGERQAEAKAALDRVTRQLAGLGAGVRDIHSYFDLVAGQIIKTRPRAVINCAGYTNVERAEAEPERALAINADGAAKVAAACARTGALLVHLSTDYVFDGRTERPYREDDPAEPQSAYGRSKLAGEKAALLAHDKVLVIRSAWFFGPGRPSFVDKVLARAEAGEEVRVVDDQVGSPTYTRDLAEAIFRLMDLEAVGIVHVANDGRASRWELARETVRLAGGDPEAVRPVSTAELGSSTARPAYSALDTGLYNRLTGEKPPAWQDGLERYLGLPMEERA